MQGLPGVAGGAILGDGTIALILDPASLLSAA
jgi:two-component system chemotaxis sensor kinase CheA